MKKRACYIIEKKKKNIYIYIYVSHNNDVSVFYWLMEEYIMYMQIKKGII